jgi:methyl-accepting chemotaxis protein
MQPFGQGSLTADARARRGAYIPRRLGPGGESRPVHRLRPGDVMTTYSVSSSSTSAVGEQKTKELPILGRRRRFLVPGSYQWRSLALLGGLTLLLLAALDMALFALVRSGSSQVLQAAPELRALVLGQDRDLLQLVLAGSVVTLFGVLLVGLLESHRTAGPIYNLTRALERYPLDGPRTRLKLRKDDHFRDLERSFNKMAAELEARSLARVAELARITSRLQQAADGLTRPGGYDAETQGTLRSLAFDLHKLGEDIERR